MLTCTSIILYSFLSQVLLTRFLVKVFNEVIYNISMCHISYFPHRRFCGKYQRHILPSQLIHGFFPKNVFHVSYLRGNTNNMSPYFVLIFPLDFYRSFSDISLYIAPHIFFWKGFWGSNLYVISLRFFPTGFFNGIPMT